MHFSTVAVPDYRALFEATPSPYLILATDFKIVSANNAYLRATRTTHDEIVGRDIFDVFPDNPDDPAASGVTALRASLLRVLRSGRPDAMAIQKYDIPVAGQAGVRFEERHWSPINTPVFDADGELSHIIHCVEDVTDFVKTRERSARMASEIDEQALEIEIANRRLRLANEKLEERMAVRIEERRRTEQKLRASEQRYRSLFESIDEGFCVIEMLYDGNGHPSDYRFCDLNPSFQNQTGLVDAVGKTMRELAPDHESHWFDIYGQVAATGVPVRFENEARALHRWYDVFAFRLEEEDGARVAVLFKDISEQKRMTASLRRSEQCANEAAALAASERNKLSALLQAAPVSIVVSDAEGRMLLANAAHRQLWGEPQGDACVVDTAGARKGWWADHSQRHGRPLLPDEWPTARILAGEEHPRDIVTIESCDVPPVQRTVLITGAPVKDSQGKIVGAVVAQMDISDRIRAEDALRQADRRKDEFLAMLAHELRNPLAPISAAADLLALGQAEEERIRQTSGIIARQVKHMSGLVDDLLDVSRVTRGLVTLDKTRLDARRILADAVEQVRPLIESRGHRLAVHTPPETAFLDGDAKRLVQVVANLLNNAAKYTPEGGDIVLNMAVEGGRISISVADNGIGMAPELQPTVFDLFTQATRTSDRAQGGLGIGLALVKRLVELHGGGVAAHSDGIGKGSRFAAWLPRLDGQDAPAPTRAHAVVAGAAGKMLKVLVVDDNADAANMLGILVEELGHRAFIELHPRAAIERARSEAPDFCLLDIGLPDMDGFALARLLRSRPETANAVLIAVSGYGQPEDREAAFSAGFDHYFAKPIECARLAGLLHH
ncbi:ATP-binding protein [Massilia sp. Root351]|uniref:ATP-binding protein n=1 Tax=Massilia sp. Root351 TaxID=1736522 RepID=UPI00138F3024|nr:ATP-binding protein [Massilia sp. Root351]